MRVPSIAIACTLAFVAGCSENGGGVVEPPGGPPVDTTGHGGGGGGVSTSGQRMLVLDAVQVVVSALSGQDFDAETKALVNYLTALPQFADAGSSPDGTVWGRFTDGTLLFIAHGPPAEMPDATAGNSAVVLAAAAPPPLPEASAGPAGLPNLSSATGMAMPDSRLVHAQAASSRVVPGGVPVSERYRLFDAMGSYFVPDVRADIAAMLDANGYAGTREDATLGALRSISADGILYIRAHGGFGSVRRDGSTKDFYALWTADAAVDSLAEATDAQLVADLKSNRVVYMLFRASRWTQALPILGPERHYGITQDFVSHYITLSANSLVYIDACSSAVLPGFRSAFTTASAFFGWSERAAFESMGPTTKYVFDRLLGANRFDPENPRQRPFEFDALSADPRFGKGKTYGWSRVTNSTGPVEAELTFHQLRGEFGLLAPSIWSLFANERQNTLEILGSFGSDPGDVTIDDGSGPQPMAVISWAADHIVANLPLSGPGSSGNVLVEVRGHLSNTRQLLAWQGTLVYTLREVGSLTQRFELDVRLRADPQDVRMRPGEAPIATLSAVVDMTTAVEARFDAGGTYSTPAGMCTAIDDWAANGTIAGTPIPPVTGASYIYGGAVVKRRAAVELVIAASHPTGLKRTATLKCPNATESGSSNTAIAVDGRIHNASNGTVMTLPLDGALDIPGLTRPLSVPSGFGGSAQATITMSWATMPARPAYDPNLPR